MDVSSFSYVNNLIASRSLPKCQNPAPKAPGQDLAQNSRFQSFFCQRFNNQLGPAQIQLQQAPGHDFAQHGRFHHFLCQRSNNHLELAQMRKSSSKRLLARVWPKMAVSSLSYASGLITIWSLPKCQNPAPKGTWPTLPFLAFLLSAVPKCQNPAPKGSWPGFGPKWPFPVFFVSSLIARWSLPKCQNPSQDLAQNDRFQFFLSQRFNSQPGLVQMQKSISKRCLATPI